MGRPPLDIGTHGDIWVTEQPNGKFMAATNFRDADGVTRPVKRFDKTPAAAKRRLKAVLVERNRRGGDELTNESRFAEVADLWLKYIDRTKRGTTWDRYRSRLNGVLPAMGNLRLREITPRRIDVYLESLEKRLAPNTVRGYRATVSGVMAHAVRLGAIDRNPCKSATPIQGRGKESRALTREERDELFAKVDADPRAVRADLPDVMRYLAGTGVRIGELMALRWFRVDLENGVVTHGDTLASETKRCKDCGLVRREHRGQCIWNDPGVGSGLVLHQPKTPAGFRVLKLPEFTTMMLRMRWPGPGFEQLPVFPCATGGWRNPSNTGRSVRLFREKAGFGWFSAHAWRHTAISACAEEGIEMREISGYHGHSNPSFTMDHYLDMTVQSGAVPAALDAAMRPRRD
ncbi:MAG TPA: site-specific integrase [Pseudonocardia sp.]